MSDRDDETGAEGWNDPELGAALRRKAKRGGRVISEADKSAEYYTPAALRALAHEILGGVDFDPATCAENPLGARRFLTALTGPALLAAPDAGAVLRRWSDELARLRQIGLRDLGLFFNPPYGRMIPLWLDALAQLHILTPVNSLSLVPCRPGSRWYVRHTGGDGADLVCELDGRVAFDVRQQETGSIVPGRDPARWGSVLLYRASELVSAEDLTPIRRRLERFGQTRLAGRRRRARARRDLAAPARRCIQPLDPNQERFSFDRAELAGAADGAWPANVLPLERHRK